METCSVCPPVTGPLHLTQCPQVSSPLLILLACSLPGMSDPPSLSALSGPIVASGDGVTLHCGSWQRFGWFYLSNEGGNGYFKSLASQRQANGWSWALFTVGPVSPSHRWMYRCYGAFAHAPYVWSSSSNILELLISGEKLTTFPQSSLTLQAAGQSLVSGGASGRMRLQRESLGLQQPVMHQHLQWGGSGGRGE